MSRGFARFPPRELGAMRREFTAISALSMAIALAAGIVLCMQVANLKLQLGWGIPGSVVWTLEVAIFGTAVYAWRSAVSLVGWMVGIAGLELVRLAVTTGAAAVLVTGEEHEQLSSAILTTSGLAPRMCAVLFALMVFYPLRILLPRRSARAVRRRRFSDSAAVKSALGSAMAGDSELVIWAGSEARATIQERSTRAARNMLETTHRRMDLEGAVQLPVQAVLAQLPPELVNERAQKIDDSQMMAIPLGAVLTQLKEARVVSSAAQIYDWLPDSAKKAVTVPAGDAGEAESVTLPLALIVPQLPSEALALPPPSPPAWASADQSEHVVFARA